MKYTKYILIFLLFCSSASAQLNVRQAPFNAVGNGVADDWYAIQYAIDSAVKTGTEVRIPAGRYKITQPLIAAKWVASLNKYEFCTVRITGDDVMWGVGNTFILPTFKDGFVFGLHMNKGSVIKGFRISGKFRYAPMSADSFYRTPITTNYDTTCRDSRYSPYAGIVIDPFRYNLPPDGGYPTLQEWYRGNNAVSGSTGVRVEDVTLEDFVVCIAVSPNGHTLNAELLTFENIRIYSCKVALAGSQPQEKLNRVINWGIWGQCRVAFMFSLYGQGKPGHWLMDGVNLAGFPAQLVERYSEGYFPLMMTNIFAEQLGFLGNWNTTMADRMSNSSINFYHFSGLKWFPEAHVVGNGVTYENVDFRYYGSKSVPIIFKGTVKMTNSTAQGYVNPIRGYRYQATDPDFKNGFEMLYCHDGFIPVYSEGGIYKAKMNKRFIPGQYTSMKVGDVVALMDGGDQAWKGISTVVAVDSLTYTIAYLPKTTRSDYRYKMGVFKSTTITEPLD